METSLRLPQGFTFAVIPAVFSSLTLCLALTFFAPMAHAIKDPVPVEAKQQGFYLVLDALKEQFGMVIKNVRYDEATDILRLENITFPAMKEQDVDRKGGEVRIDLIEVHQPQWHNFAKDSTALLAEKLIFTNINQIVGDANTLISHVGIPQTIVVKPEINLTALMAFFTKEFNHNIVAKLLEGSVAGIELAQLTLKIQTFDSITMDPYYQELFMEKFSTKHLSNGFVDVEVDRLEVKNSDALYTMKKARIEKIALPTQAELQELNKQIQASAPDPAGEGLEGMDNLDFEDDIFFSTFLSNLTAFRPGRPPYTFVDIQQAAIQTLDKKSEIKKIPPLLNLEHYQARLTSPTAQNPAFTAEGLIKGSFFIQSIDGENAPATQHPFNYTSYTELQPGAKVSTIMADGNGSGHELYFKLDMLLNLAEDLSTVVFDEDAASNLFLTGNLVATDIVYKDRGLMNSILAWVANTEYNLPEAERQSWIDLLMEAKTTLKAPHDIKNVDNLLAFVTKPGTLRISQNKSPLPLASMLAFVFSPFINLPFDIVAE